MITQRRRERRVFAEKQRLHLRRQRCSVGRERLDPRDKGVILRAKRRGDGYHLRLAVAVSRLRVKVEPALGR